MASIGDFSTTEPGDAVNFELPTNRELSREVSCRNAGAPLAAKEGDRNQLAIAIASAVSEKGVFGSC